MAASHPDPRWHWPDPGQLLALLQEGIFLRDLSGRIVYWSRGAETTYGWAAAAAQDRISHELLHTRFPRLREIIEQSCLRQGYWEGELRQRRRDGRWIAVASRWELYRDAGGEPAGMLEVNRDVSSERRLEARQQLRLAVGAWLARGEPWPEGAAELLRILTQLGEWDASELWGMNPQGIWERVAGVGPLRKIGRAELAQRVATSGRPEAEEDRPGERLAVPVPVHGRVEWVLALSRRRREADAAEQGVLADLAAQLGRHLERAHALHALQQAEVRFRALLESAPDAMVIVDEAGRITETNRRVEEILGYAADELLGRPMDVLLPERLRSAHAIHWRNYFQAPRARPMGAGLELSARRHDGSEVPVEISLSPIRLAGEVLVAAAIRDVSIRRKLETEARRAQNLQMVEMEHRATLGEIAAGLAHEIKNPLAGMSAALEVLAGECSGPHQAIMAEVREQVGRIQSTVEELLHYARPRPLQLERGDLNATLSQVLPMAMRMARARGVRFTFRPGTLPPVEHDLDQVQRMVVNLVLNALDAVETGGEVELSSEERAGWAVIEVRDNGAGIPQAALPKIFRPFFTTKGGKGTGLGLALCLRIAELHAGAIGVETCEGQGTTFTIRLPLHPGAARSHEGTHAG